MFTDHDIQTAQRDGFVVLVHSGMDCDGVRFSHKVKCKAQAKEVNALADSLLEYSDGYSAVTLERKEV